ncbi:hypothetical protein Tco_1345060 [Tanacetum coccineum]
MVDVFKDMFFRSSNKARGARDTLVVVILEVNSIIDLIIPPRKAPRTKTTTATTTNTTSVTNAQLHSMIEQGVTAALAARDANRNGDDSHTSGTETVFRISHCSVENQIKFSTCTLLAGALTWWNSHVRIVANEMKKLEDELLNLKVKESDKVERYVGGLPDMIHGSFVASKQINHAWKANEMGNGVDGQKYKGGGRD